VTTLRDTMVELSMLAGYLVVLGRLSTLTVTTWLTR
jgi:hypothetical protein